MKLNVYQRNVSLRYITGQLIDTLFKFRIRDCTVMARFSSSSKSKVVNKSLGNGNCQLAVSFNEVQRFLDNKTS